MKKNSKAQHIPLGFFQGPIGRMIPILKQKKVSKVAHWDFSDPKDACQKLELCTIESSEKIGSPGACRCRWFAGLLHVLLKKTLHKKKNPLKHSPKPVWNKISLMSFFCNKAKVYWPPKLHSPKVTARTWQEAGSQKGNSSSNSSVWGCELLVSGRVPTIFRLGHPNLKPSFTPLFGEGRIQVTPESPADLCPLFCSPHVMIPGLLRRVVASTGRIAERKKLLKGLLFLEEWKMGCILSLEINHHLKIGNRSRW